MTSTRSWHGLIPKDGLPSSQDTAHGGCESLLWVRIPQAPNCCSGHRFELRQFLDEIRDKVEIRPLEPPGGVSRAPSSLFFLAVMGTDREGQREAKATAAKPQQPHGTLQV